MLNLEKLAGLLVLKLYSSYLERNVCRCYCTVLRLVRWKSLTLRHASSWWTVVLLNKISTLDLKLLQKSASFILILVQSLIKSQNGHKNFSSNRKTRTIYYRARFKGGPGGPGPRPPPTEGPHQKFPTKSFIFYFWFYRHSLLRIYDLGLCIVDVNN